MDSTGHPLGVLLEDCKKLIAGFSSLTVRHVFREANKCADGLANLAHGANQGVTDLASPLQVILDLLEADAMGIAHLRFPSHLSSSSPSSSSEDEIDLIPIIEAQIQAIKVQQKALLNVYANNNLFMTYYLEHEENQRRHESLVPGHKVANPNPKLPTMSSKQGGKLKPLKQAKSDKKEYDEHDMANIQKKKEEEKALKELRAKAQQKGSFGGSGLKKSGKK
ncbi:hypothetical protein CRYUN_Cryun31cG0089400 [Craigia yunnanensis]